MHAFEVPGGGANPFLDAIGGNVQTCGELLYRLATQEAAVNLNGEWLVHLLTLLLHRQSNARSVPKDSHRLTR